ncbi:MAG: hypothetical protein ABGY96_06045 [bacterium]|nr:hypothetical protein [Gammaproteobacteria bacterium]HIL95442.1 hypothetical protein [Pseudomonadales bacterium]
MPDSLIPDNLPVFLIFLSQILVVSVYLPLRRYKLRWEIFETHPVSEYPRYYPQTIEFERRRLTIGRNLPLFIALVGLGFFCLAWVSNYSQVTMTRVVLLFCMVQIVPVAMWEIWDAQRAHQMRAKDQSTTRKAELRVRHLSDFVSPLSITVAIVMYVFATFAMGYIYLNDLWSSDVRWKLPALLFVNALMVLGFGGLGVFHKLYGKRIDPYMANLDRMQRIAKGIKILAYMSIVYSFFILVLLSMQTFDLVLELNAIVTSIFYQAILAYGVLHAGEKRDFEVYREAVH